MNEVGGQMDTVRFHQWWPDSNVFAIAMWDFSWLERTWVGGGYDSWPRALDELAERGYTAVRIDAYPHMVSSTDKDAWVVDSHWWFLCWGTCGATQIRPWPALAEFISQCEERGIRVLLSSWYRDDLTHCRMQIASPEVQAHQWCTVIQKLKNEGLIGSILGVDLCNEFPGDAWAPYFDNAPDSSWDGTTARAQAWASEALRAFRREHPSVPATVSFSGYSHSLGDQLDEFSFLEPHIWMSQLAKMEGDLCPVPSRFSPEYLNALASRGEALYRANEEVWLGLLRARIADWARIADQAGLPLITTEGWSVVDARDWPLLDWGWIKEACEVGVESAIATQQWIGVCTSNFCGPQFEAMWRDVEWHRRLTNRIHRGYYSRSSGVR